MPKTIVHTPLYPVKDQPDSKAGICLECGDSIGYGRTDRKFCCDACKNKYNNRKTRSSRVIKLRILNALDKNHRILEHLLRMGVTSIDISSLKQLGFNMDYMTSCHKTRGHTEIWCFDIRFEVTETRVRSISRVQAFILPEGKGQ